MYAWVSGYVCEWDELSVGTPLGDSFVANKNEHFDEYLAKHNVKKDTLDDFDYDDQMFWFLKGQEQDWYDKLDDIFADYLCD